MTVKALTLIAAATAAAKLAWGDDRSPTRVLAEVAIVQGALIAIGTITNSAAMGHLTVGVLGYGAMIQGCGVIPVVAHLLRSVQSSSVPDALRGADRAVKRSRRS